MRYETCPSECAAMNHPGEEHEARVISDEAVEAAARAWVSRHAQPGNWTLEENLLAALKAAAPHMLKDADASNILFGAWDAGYHAHMSDGYDWQTPNPYWSES